jgi:hypothetical protein
MKSATDGSSKFVWLSTSLISLFIITSLANAAGVQPRDDKMSVMGKRAAAAVARVNATASGAARPTARAMTSDEGCINDPACGEEGDEDEEAAPGGQAELSIAVDESGQHIVIGFNDTRGFALNPISVSGFMYSEDGGKTFVDGGQLPSPGNDVIGTTRFPQVFGDPEVKYLGNCVFVYSSILVEKVSNSADVQTMGVHRSRDCGKTWEGPFEVTSVTNPSGIVVGGVPQDAADKEFMDVDPDTGRVMMSWSNFTPAPTAFGVEIRTTYSDNLKNAATPTWSQSVVVASTESDGQASIPRFAARSNRAYVAWRRFPFPGTFFGFGNSVALARSIDNGATWLPPIETAEFFTMDQVLGNDRVNTSPSLAVDNSRGPHRGTVYLVYANNNSGDGADIVFQKSTNGGATLSEPVEINASPGKDRPQWFPWVSVDTLTGRVSVFYYDQGIDTSGDLTEVSYTFSDDAGAHWSAPVALTKIPFHAGWGNDTGQPNLGDYNQAVSQHGELFAAYAMTAPPPAGFVDGQPSTGMTTPNIEFKRVGQFSWRDVNSLPLAIDVNGVTTHELFGNHNGFLDPGETILLRLPLSNYTTNDISAEDARNVSALLTSETPGVVVLQPLGDYGRIDSGESAPGNLTYLLRLKPGFDPGTPINLRLSTFGRFGGGGSFEFGTLRHKLFTGTPQITTLLTESFDAAPVGTLPAGWSSAHGGGANIVPWVTSNTFCGATSNAAFHQNANDNGTGDPTRFERLFSTNFAVPADSDYVTIDFDVCTDTEFDPNFNVLAYDGLTLRVTDMTAGHTLRSVLAEAFADEFTTGVSKHLPKHLPRSGNTAYLQDMSVWAGDSNGPQHVRLRLPGMAGTTAQMRFEFTQDGFGTCLDVGGGPVCGVSVDNIVISSVKSIAAPLHH